MAEYGASTYVIRMALVITQLGDIFMLPDIPIYNSPDKFRCFPCPPGMMVTQHCQENLTNSTCAPCPERYYMDKYNEKTYCESCSQPHCPQFASKIQNCTKITNNICQCNDGYHRYPLDPADDWLNCREHTGCEAGEGIIHSGNHSHDRECKPCNLEAGSEQEYVSKSDPENPVCQLCSSCPEGFIEKHCSTYEDAICHNSNVTMVDTSLTTTTESAETSSRESSILSNGVVAGIVFSVIFFIIILVFSILFIIAFIRWRNNDQPLNNEQISFCGHLQRVFHSLKCWLCKPPCTPNALKEDRQRELTSLSNGNRRLLNNSPSAERPLPLPAELPEAAELMNNEEQESETEQSTATENVDFIASTEYSHNYEDIWQESFIKRTVFPYLSQNIGSQWKQFIHTLPGPEGVHQDRIVEYAVLDSSHTSDAILIALTEWSKRAPQFVNRYEIIKALKTCQLNLIVEEVQKLT